MAQLSRMALFVEPAVVNAADRQSIVQPIVQCVCVIALL